jgi:hypothetical protein
MNTIRIRRSRSAWYLLMLTFTLCTFFERAAFATTMTFTDTLSVPFEVLGIPVGTATWQTSVSLIVPVTVMPVGAIEPFTIIGNVTNSITGVSSLTDNIATVFGNPTFNTGNIQNNQPYDSMITINGSKIFVGPSNPWVVNAFDQASSGTSSFSASISGVEATYTSQVQGPTTADWFEPIGLSNQDVEIENRVLSATNHGKFSGTGAHFEINGFFQDLGVGTSTLEFLSQANYTDYGVLAGSQVNNQIYGTKVMDLKVDVTSVPEPGTWLLLITGLATASLTRIEGARCKSLIRSLTRTS